MADISIRWKLDVIGDGAVTKMLQQDRLLQRELRATDAAYGKVAAAAKAASTSQAAALRGVATNATSAGRATSRLGAQSGRAAQEARLLASAQEAVAAANSQAAASAERARRANERLARTTAGAARRAERSARGGGFAAAAGGIGGAAAARTGAIAAPLVGGISIALATKQAVEFDQAMRNVNSIAQLSERRFDSLSERVRKLAGPTAQAPKTLAEGLYDLVSSGFDANQAIRILGKSARAATAGMTDTQTSTAAVAAVLNAYHLKAKDAGRVSDQLFRTVDRGVISFEQLAGNIGDVLPFASSLGVDLAQVGASIATMTKQGISAPETMTRIKAVMQSFIKPSQAMAAAIDKTGASSGEALVKQKGFQGALETLIGTTDGSKQEIAKLFPNVRALGGALALTGDNAKTAHQDLNGMKDAAGATGRALGEQSKSLAMRWQKLTSQVSSLAVGLGGKLVPALGGVLDQMNQLVQGKGPVAEFFSDIAGGVTGRQPKPVLAGAPGHMRGVDSVGVQQQETLGRRIGQILRTVGQGAAQAGRAILDALKPAQPFLQNVILPLLDELRKTLPDIGRGIVAGFGIGVRVVKAFANIIGTIGKLAGAVQGPLRVVFRVMLTMANPILLIVRYVRLLISVGRTVGRALSSAFSAAVDAVKTAASAVAGAFSGLPGKLAGVARRAGRALINGVGGFAGDMAKTGVRLAARAANGFKGFARLVKDAMVDAVKEIRDFFFGLGAQIVRSIVNGIKSAPGAIGGALADAAKNVPGLGAVLRAAGARRGGRATADGFRRFQAGGMVPALVSPGEMVLHGNRAWTVPGSPVAADSVFAPLPVGAAVLTWDGQARMAAGEPLSSVLANQAPHFRTGGQVLSPGQMATLAYQHGVKPKHAAVRMGAIGMRESHGRSWVHNYDPPRDDSWGLWQINVLPNANPRFRNWKLTDPNVNAKAMSLLWKAAGERPWGGYAESSFSGWLDDAARGFGKGATISVPTTVRASTTRRGLVDDALAQGIAAGQAGLTRREIHAANQGVYGARLNPIFDAIRSARQPTSRKVTIDEVSGGSKGRGRSGVGKVRGSYAMVSGDTDFLPALGTALSRMARSAGVPIFVSSGGRTLAEQASLVAQKGAWSPTNPGAAAATPNAPHVRGVAADIRPGRERFGGVAGRFGLGFTVSNEPWHVQLLRRGGRVGVPGAGQPGVMGAKTAARRRGLDLMRSIWQVAAPYYGRSPDERMPAVRFWSNRMPIVGMMEDAKGSRAVRLRSRQVAWPDWVNKDFLKRDPSMLGMLLHEWTHYFQKSGLKSAAQEGGAQLLTRRIAPEIFKKLGITYQNVPFADDQYPGEMARTKRKHGERWIRRGQLLPRFQTGGPVASAATRVSPTIATRADSVLTSGVKFTTEIDEMLGRLTAGRLTVLRDALLARAREGGLGTSVQRLREMVSGIDAELGRRIGLIDYRAERNTRRSELFTGYMQRADRRRMIGITDDDTRAVAEQEGAKRDAGMAEAKARRNLRLYRRQYRLAQRSGDKTEIDRASENLETAGADLDEAITAKLEAQAGVLQAVKQAYENARQKVLDDAQALVDIAQHPLNMAQGGLDRLDAVQRLTGIADTPAAMRERAAAISTSLVPQLQAYGQELNNQLAKQGNLLAGLDVNDVEARAPIEAAQRATLEAIQSNGTSIANAMADAGDLIRQAAEKAAQDMVDLASHNRTMADLGRQRLELEQRLAGVYEAGGQARADFIRRTEIPALEAELAALLGQQQVEMQVGNQELARQIAEAIAAKQNDILQAQLDATEEVAANTKPRAFGGSLAFAFGDETLTDALVAAGNGV